MSWRADPKLPELVRTRLGALCDQLARELGSDLEAVLLWGALARGDEFYPRTTRVELLIALREVHAAALSRVAPALRRARQGLRVTVMVVTRDDLRRSTDVFPTKFAHMRAHHLLLHGVDPLAGCEVSPEHLRLRCEQELRNLQLRLRAAYMGVADQEAEALRLLGDMGVDFVEHLRTLLELRAGQAPSTMAEVVEAVGPLELEKAVLEELLAIHRGRYQPAGEELRRLVERFLTATDRAAHLADSHAAGDPGGQA